jgi:hypothetical protein
MLTLADLEQAFKVHFDEMEKCEDKKCYWALLHLVVILPDICGALDLPGQIWSRVNDRLDRNQGGHGHAQETVYA